MGRFGRRMIGRPRGVVARAVPWTIALLLALQSGPWTSSAATIVLKDGRRLTGNIAPVHGLADSPQASQADLASIALVDDKLRRIFVPLARVAKIDEVESGEIKEKIAIRQRVARRESGGRISQVGQLINIQPFDQFGRRSVRMATDKGPLDIVQGITLVTPSWTRVEALAGENRKSVAWEMSLATSAIPRDTLKRILAGAIDSKNLDQRLRVARLFIQAERYLDAQQELEGVMADFPQEQELAKEVQALRQLYAKSIIREIDVRRKAGQHALAYAMLEQFPNQDVAGDTLQQVRETLSFYRDTRKQVELLFKDLKGHVDAVANESMKAECEAVFDEMQREFGYNTLDRVAAYLRLSDDPDLGHEQKLSLAITGWLLGSDGADTNLIVALSLFKVRELVARYMNEGTKLKRNEIFSQIQGHEGASPALVARLIAHMKPPLETPEPSPSEPGFYQFSIPVGIDKEPDATYYVQLPPHYDPHVHYPTIVTLCGETSTARHQVDWWAAPDEKYNRLGHATRLGYIVVAVDWMKDGQTQYEFSAREHAAVLGSLRDACRRFSIDTDRVFLTGHSIGGDAAWDIGLAHPDLWCGVIPIVAQAEKYCRFYLENAKLVPFYVLGGQLDGDKTVKNARDLDRYLQKRFDVTVVEYQGRGHEDFYEDIKNLFEWMGRRESRNFFPKEFTVSTMRTWDNFFWWLEAGKLPPKAVVEPTSWPPAHGVTSAKIGGRVLPTNGLAITTGASSVTVWLSPEVVDFNRDMEIRVNNRTLNKKRRIDPDLSVLLEDVRTRADRQHPFWATVSQ